MVERSGPTSDEPPWPAGVPRGGPDIGDDPAAAERHGRELLRQAGAEIADGVGRVLPGWAVREAGRLLDAWGRHDESERREILEQAREAGEAAAERIRSELDELFGQDPAAQRITPLQVVRTAHREVGAVLADAGVPPVQRDEFEERAFPDDDYGLVPDTFADLGAGELQALHLAWGVAKATVHKARRAAG